MQLLPEARGGVPERDGVAIGSEWGGNVAVTSGGGGEGGAAAEPVASKGAGFGVHPAARASGRSGGVRGFVERRDQLPEPERIRAGHATGSGCAVHAGSRSDIRAD